MKFIIDTHIFLWALSTPSRIAPHKRNELETPTNIIYISSITIAELMIKASIGKLDITPLIQENLRCKAASSFLTSTAGRHYSYKIFPSFIKIPLIAC